MDNADVLIRPAIASKTSDIQSTVVHPIAGKTITSDAAQIAAIYNHYVDLGGATFDEDHWTIKRANALLATRPPDGWYVADDGGQVQGWASLRRFSDRHGFRFACETAIYLKADSVGRGIADLLQSRIDVHCREHRVHHAVARIIATNQRSLAFHFRHGYELVGTQKEIGYLNGQWTDLTILQKIFKS